MTDPSQLPAAIRARVHDGAIDRVTRFFAATIASAAVEIVQNSRRSGATRLDVVTQAVADASGAIRVAVTDDGQGIPDPAVLLSFGESRWDEDTARREDPAGMGVYALSKRGCVVSSRPRGPGGQARPGWRVTLTPDCFLGKEEVPVTADDEAPHPHGTTIAFLAEETLEAIQAAIAGAARHCPLPVTFNGEPVERKSFLDGAVHAERWRGLAFGVFRNRLTGFNNPDLNFHGLTLAVRLPAVDAIEAGTWSVRADIEACPELELVLPARREAVETPFLEEMREAARLAIYSAMAAADPEPRVAFEDHRKAAEAGISLPEPPAELRRWRPGIADIDDWRDVPPYAPVGVESLVMAADLETPDAQAFWRAAERAGIAGRLFEGDTRFEGYAWYDALARVRDLRIAITEAGFTHPLDALRAPSPPSSRGTTAPGFSDTLARPDAIHMYLNIVRGDGRPEAMTVPADIAFVGEDGAWIDDAKPLVTRDSDLQPAELSQLLRAAYFSASDDADSDSYDTQRRRFDEDAIHMALKLLASADEAIKHTIAEAVWREICWVVPRDREVSITVSDRKVSVEFGPADPGTRGGGGMTQFTVQCGYPAFLANTVTVEADTLEEALEKAIEKANDDPGWKSLDHCGPTHVDACCEGADADPWDPEATLPVPERFTEKGEPPVVTLTGARPPGGIQVSGGTVRLRFEGGAGTVTTEVSDPPPPPGNKLVVIVRPRPDRAPDVLVRGGKAIVRIEGWDDSETPRSGA